MQNHLSEFKIITMSWVLGVSGSGFYRFRQRAGQPEREQKRMVLDKLDAESLYYPKNAGRSPRLVLDLLDQGRKYDCKTVVASTQRHNLRARAARKYKAATNSTQNLPVAPNLLAQNFSACTPNQKWVSAISRTSGPVKAGCIWL